MCGIHATVSRDIFPSPSTGLSHRLECRGPDHRGRAEICLQPADSAGSPIHLSFISTVLSLRGDHVTPQPFVDPDTKSVLCWNGEAWKIDGKQVEGNDGAHVFSLLVSASIRGNNEGAILDVLRNIQGPFAFVFFDMLSRRLFFGRDRLGRRSLLVHDSENGLSMSSVADLASDTWQEVEADGIYVLDILTWNGSKDGRLSPIRRSWTTAEANMVSSLGIFNTSLPTDAPPLNAGSASVQALYDGLTASMRLRVLSVPTPRTVEDSENARVAVLFSGGLDCTVLARLASDLLPPEQAIDLINVAFENPRLVSLAKADQSRGLEFYEACPDRITGRQSFDELSRVCPGRQWKFVAVDVPYSEVLAKRGEVIMLMHPHNTEMDLSIAYALYFAARGRGMSQRLPGGPAMDYTSSARVLLSGLGADELFGGYGRHSSAFSRQGYSGLIDELMLDVNRLGKRNLGRDDRVMAHWGREVRFPYLDEQLVTWAVESPVWEKCDFGSAQDESHVEPGKRVLRLLAERLGLHSVAREKKRAIQFGSRTAKMESGRVKGTTVIAP